MSRTDDLFERLHSRGQKALITYVMAGYPSVSATQKAVRGMVKGGADIIELGFPFSDPLADGPAIQRAAVGAIRSKMSLDRYFELVRKIRAANPQTPLLMMTYANILYSRGYRKVCSEAISAGLDGFIIPDMPPEESTAYHSAAKKAGLDTVFLASPNTVHTRMGQIASVSAGFLYMVAVYGTTGARKKARPYTAKAIRGAKKTPGLVIPVGAGFGVRTAQDAKRYADAGADAVIVGSAYVEIIEKSPAGALEGRVCAFTRKLRAGLDAAGRKPT